MWLHESAPDDLDDSRVVHETEVTVSSRQSLRNNASNNKYLRRGHNPHVSVMLRLLFVCVKLFGACMEKKAVCTHV